MSAVYQQARAAWQAAKDQRKADSIAPIPADLLAAAKALQAALAAQGITSTILPSAPAQPPRPARVIDAAEVAGLDARDPRRALHQYQRAYSLRGKPVPQHITEAMRLAAHDQQRRAVKRW